MIKSHHCLGMRNRNKCNVLELGSVYILHIFSYTLTTCPKLFLRDEIY